jgi:hypothetical protein
MLLFAGGQPHSQSAGLGLVLARRVISLQSSASVAFGGKRTSTDGQSRPVASRMTLNRHSGRYLFGSGTCAAGYCPYPSEAGDLNLSRPPFG